MPDSTYRVDPRMIPPVAMAMGFGACLVFLEGFTNRGILLAFILAPFFYLGLEILARRITLDSRGILVSKFLRSVFVEWPDVEALDAVRTGSKLFLIIQSSTARPILVTNTISPFKDLTRNLQEFIGQGKISEECRRMLEEPPTKLGPMAQAWIVCLVLAGLVLGKFLGYA